MSKKSPKGGMANPLTLPAAGDKHRAIIRVVIETPKGSRNKYAFNRGERVFELTKVLPAGMSFPYDFGFVPSTLAADGDPVDVLVLMDEPAFAGCVLKARVIGIIEGEQSGKKGTERNDRVVAIEQDNHSFSGITAISDLGKQFVHELEDFFVNYHELSGEQYRILSVKGIGRALKRIAEGRQAVRHGS